MYRQNGRCSYCGYMLGDTKDHVLLKIIARLINYDEPDGNILIHKNDHRNIVNSCRFCNRSKGSSIILPTVSNVYTYFKYFCAEDLSGFADYLYENRDCIKNFIEYDSSHILVYGNKFYKHILTKEMNEFILLYENGYFNTIEETLKVINM